MYACQYPHLFSPIRLGDTVFRNRYFAAPVGYEYLTCKNYPLDETIAFFERKAMGGAATVNVGSAVPDSNRGCIGNSQLPLDDPGLLPPLYRLASAINRHGAVAAVELQHCGPYAYTSALGGNQIYGAVGKVNPVGQFVPAMTEEIIEETIEAYAQAAAFAKFCGFGLVMIHAGHGWLINQFLDPNINDRKDRWGGSRENRCRFLLAIVERIRRTCGRGFPIEVRISGSMCYEGGYGIDEGVAIAKQLDGKVDLIHVSAGSHEAQAAGEADSANLPAGSVDAGEPGGASYHSQLERSGALFTVTHPSIFLPDGVNVQYAAEVKKHVRTPVATVGALSDPALMEEIIASGQADVVQTARAMIADPDLPKKARAGKSDEIRPCIRCFECFAGITTKRQYRCAVNPEIGFEQDSRHELPASKPKTVLIAGGGIAGMEAALVATQRGHQVILCEKGNRLGGALRCEEKVPFKRLLAQYLDYQTRMISRVPIEVRLGVSVTPEYAAAAGVDVLIAALGARPCTPKIPGVDRPNVLGAEEAYHHPEKTGASVVVLGGGLVGIELAIYLAGLGRKLTIVEMMDSLSDGGNPIHALALIGEISRYGIQVVTSTKAVEIDRDGIVGEYVGSAYTLPVSTTVEAAVLQSNPLSAIERTSDEIGSRKLYPADTVVYAVGQQQLHDEADALRFCAPEFHQIGDCWMPRNIYQATRMAYAVARDI
jgi:2,4-dienoyl-CoA reductase-like NADH-dependent reductase (Old Yellow Enzyme family)/thioredoxin reductase